MPHDAADDIFADADLCAQLAHANSANCVPRPDVQHDCLSQLGVPVTGSFGRSFRVSAPTASITPRGSLGVRAPGISLSAERTPLGRHVGLIRSRRSQPEMPAPLIQDAANLIGADPIGLNASPYVAGVADLHTVRDISFAGENPRCFVSYVVAPIEPEHAVAVGCYESRPVRARTVVGGAVRRRDTSLDIGIKAACRIVRERPNRVVGPRARTAAKLRTTLLNGIGSCQELLTACHADAGHGTILWHRSSSLRCRAPGLLTQAPGYSRRPNFTTSTRRGRR